MAGLSAYAIPALIYEALAVAGGSAIARFIITTAVTFPVEGESVIEAEKPVADR